jgi:hypothetical protein
MAVTEIAENGLRAERWNTVEVDRQDGGACGAMRPVAAGTYRATFFVFDSPPSVDADLSQARRVTVEFALPSPTNVVSVRLNVPAMDAGADDML